MGPEDHHRLADQQVTVDLWALHPESAVFAGTLAAGATTLTATDTQLTQTGSDALSDVTHVFELPSTDSKYAIGLDNGGGNLGGGKTVSLSTPTSPRLHPDCTFRTCSTPAWVSDGCRNEQLAI